jgi:hypothetical protein
MKMQILFLCSPVVAVLAITVAVYWIGALLYDEPDPNDPNYHWEDDVW